MVALDEKGLMSVFEKHSLWFDWVLEMALVGPLEADFRGGEEVALKMLRRYRIVPC